MTEQEEAKLKIAKILGIEKDKIEYEEMFFKFEETKAVKCFLIRNIQNKLQLSKNKISLLSEYPLIFEDCNFDSFEYSSFEISNVLSFKQCTIDYFFAQGVKFKSFFEIEHCNIGAIHISAGCVFEDSVNFKGTIFKGVSLNPKRESEIFFYGVEFKKNVYFNKARFEFKFNPSNIVFIKEVSFDSAHFLANVLFIRTEFKDNANFLNTKFEKECNFEQVDFEKDVNFDNVIFENYAGFKKINFNNANFSFSKFEYVNFYQAKFQSDINFYEAIFNEAPNFSQAIFKGNLNLINAKLNFDFKNLKEKIQEEYNNYKEERPLENFANDFRDSFRNFKSVLIEDNNLLDASNFHKLELYCKEIELKAIWDKRGSEEINKKEIQTSMEKFTKFIDFLLLGFYRKLSDHHTDFLKVFNNLILLIALYASFIYIGDFNISWIANNETNSTSNTAGKLLEYLRYPKEMIINSEFIQKYGFCILLLLIVFALFCIGNFIIKKFYRDIRLRISDILNGVFKDFKHLCVIIVLLGGCMIFLNMYIPESCNTRYIFINIGGFYLFIALYLWLIYLGSTFLRYVLICISYIIVSIAIGVNIAILNPFIGKLVNGSNSNPDNHYLFIVITFAYTILMALVLFSLQKTARKNSIVPN